MELKEILEYSKTRFAELEAEYKVKYKAEKDYDYWELYSDAHTICQLIHRYLEIFLNQVDSSEPVTEVQVLKYLFESHVEASENSEDYEERFALEAIYEIVSSRENMDAYTLTDISNRTIGRVRDEKIGRMNDELVHNALADWW